MKTSNSFWKNVKTFQDHQSYIVPPRTWPENLHTKKASQLNIKITFTNFGGGYSFIRDLLVMVHVPRTHRLGFIPAWTDALILLLGLAPSSSRKGAAQHIIPYKVPIHFLFHCAITSEQDTKVFSLEVESDPEGAPCAGWESFHSLCSILFGGTYTANGVSTVSLASKLDPFSTRPTLKTQILESLEANISTVFVFSLFFLFFFTNASVCGLFSES